MTRRILITGVGGFAGPYLARRLSGRGDVTLGAGVDALPSATRSSLAGYWQADIRAGETIREVLSEAKPTAVVHLAAQSSSASSFERPVETFETNAVGTYTLLEAVRRVVAKARVLVVGTGDVYGPQPTGTRATEGTPFYPMSPYALSKAAADGIAETCARLWGLDVVRTRSFGHVGPGQDARFLVASWCRQIAEMEALREAPAILRVGNLEVTRDLTDVRDVVEAYVSLLDRGRSGVAYNVCRGEGTRLDGLAESLSRRARLPIRVEQDASRVREADVPYLVGDPSLIREHTGWKATIPLDQTLDETLAEWRDRVHAERASNLG